MDKPVSSTTLLEDLFREFCLACFGDISEQQFIDLRRTFFGGASALFFLIMEKLSGGGEATDDDLMLVMSLRREIFQFNEDVKSGKK